MKKKIYWVYLHESALSFLQQSGFEITQKDNAYFIACKKITETMHFLNLTRVHRHSPDSDSGYEIELSLPYQYVLYVASFEESNLNKILGFQTSQANTDIQQVKPILEK